METAQVYPEVKKNNGWIGPSSSVEDDEKQRRLDKLKSAGFVVTDEMLADPRLTAALKLHDTNHDGVLDANEIQRIINDLTDRKKQVSTMKVIITLTTLVVFVLLFCNTLLTWWMIELTRDTKVSKDNSLQATSTREMIKTDKPRYYTSLADITNMPASALNALNRLSFTTEDAHLHNYEVLGK